MNNEVINLLIQADAALDKISVSSESVILLSMARKQLKAAFDRLASDQPKEEPDGG